ncbi:MAG: FG-GAP-like repeat-containing protein [Pyrinomonadaceae bacterium]
MKKSPSLSKNRFFGLVVTVLICGTMLNAQDLKSMPQGNEFLKLNGSFEIPADASLGKSAATSMIISDLNGDGINELITGRENGISIQMGDINAFAPKTQEAWEAIRDLRFLSPFRRESKSIELPLRAEVLLAGDFDRDGLKDIIVASKGGSVIYLISGDGAGNYRNIREISLSGRITSLASGDVNRMDGLPDIITATDSDGTYALTIYQGLGDIFSVAPEVFELSSPAEQILTGQFDESTFSDIAIASGNQLIIFSGHEKDSERTTPFILPQRYGIKGIATGDFIPDRDYRSEFALLGDDGYVRILSRGDLDTRPVSKQELLAIEAFRMQKEGMPIPQRILKQISQSDLREKPESNSSEAANWSEADSFFGATPGEAFSSGAMLTSARLSNRAGDDLILIDRSNKSVIAMPLIVNDDGEKGVRTDYTGKRQAIRFEVDGAPISIAADRLNFDGDKDLIIVEEGKSSPTTLMSAPEAAFTVNNAGDQVDANPGNGVCATAGAVCTLRAAIMEANHLAGTDSITINAGINTTLSTGSPDNDANGVFNFEGGGDLDITCAVNAGGDTCNAPLATNVNNLTITGAAGGNTIAVGAFAPFAPLTSTTDRVFDIGFDGLFGGGFGAGTGLQVTMSNLTIQSGNVREDFNAGGGGFGNFARGGAIRLDGFGQAGTRGTLTLTSVIITFNQADHNTGGVFNQFANISISSSTVSNNIGKAGPGGGLQFAASTPATLSVSGSTFSGNEARTGPIFMGTAIDVDGGGIYATLDSNTATITSTNFNSNISQDDGGGIYVASGATTVTGGTMAGNTARDDGGFAAGDNDTVSAARFMTLSGVTIQGNTANSDSSGGGDGGGVFRDRGTLNVTNCIVGSAGNPNAAVNGGGIAHAFRAAVTPSNQATINIDNGSITANNATTDGGGVFINATNQNVGTPSVLNVGSTTSVSVSENNSRVHGGGFAVSGGVTDTLTRATFSGNDADSDNNASGDGGGLYHNNSGGTSAIASTVSFTSNGNGATTTENGGAIHHSNGTLTLNSPGVSGNDADVQGGGLFVSGGIVNVNGVTFSANTFPANAAEVRLTGGTTNFSGTIGIPGELSIAGGTLSAGSSTVNLGEDFHFTSGTFTAGTSSFNFNGSGAQKIYGGAVPTFNNLTDANTAAQLLINNNANANGNLTVNANAGINPAAASVIGGTGTLTGSGAVLVTRTAATADFLSQYTITNKTLTNLLVDYVGAGAQVLSGTTYGNLEINNASGVTLSGTATVNGTLILTAGALSAGTGTLNINNGTSVTGGSITSAATGTVNYGQTSNGQTVLAGNYGNLTFSNFNKVLPLMTVGIAGTFTPGSAVGHTVTGSNINFNGTSAQTIPVFPYVGLTLANAAGASLGGTLIVNGSLGLASGVLNVGTNNLTLNAAAAQTGGSFNSAATGTVFYNQGSDGQNVLTGNYGNLAFSNFNKTLPAGTVGIAGNFTPGLGTPTVTGNTINFNGTSAQTIPVFPYNGLTLNNATGATLLGNVSVTGGLILTNGILATGFNTLTVASGGTMSSTTGYVIGNLRKDLVLGNLQQSPSATFTFPVGTATGFSPVTANFSGTGSLTVRAFDGTAPSTPALSDATTLDRYWQLTETGDITASLTFNYLQADVDGLETNYRMIRAAAGSPPIRFPNGAPCPGAGSPCVDSGANTIFSNNVQTFDNFWTAGEPVAPTAANVTVSGRVFAEGGGLRNAIVTITDSQGVTRSTRTSSFGNYSFSGVEVGRDYVISVAGKGYTFQPRIVTVNDNVADLDFTASP